MTVATRRSEDAGSGAESGMLPHQVPGTRWKPVHCCVTKMWLDKGSASNTRSMGGQCVHSTSASRGAKSPRLRRKALQGPASYQVRLLNQSSGAHVAELYRLASHDLVCARPGCFQHASAGRCTTSTRALTCQPATSQTHCLPRARDTCPSIWPPGRPGPRNGDAS